MLFTCLESYFDDTFLPKLFKATVSCVNRSEGGSFEFLKRVHEVKPGYESIGRHV